MATHGLAALSELAESFRRDEERRITRKDFEAALRRHLCDSHVIMQLWNKLCKEGRRSIGQGEVCSFLLREMQQRESQARAHLSLPLSHYPSFSSMPNTKETVCAVLPLSNPPQYISVSKDGCVGVWTTRFHLQQATSIVTTERGKRVAGRKRSCPGAVWVTDCVMMCGRVVVATTARELSFYDTISFSCLHRVRKLPYVPLCLAYGCEDEDCPTSPGHLVWGDEKGCVGVLSFAQPSKSLFSSTISTFNRLEEKTSEVTVRYSQAHSDWVCQVGWSGPAHCIISAAQSLSPSLLIQHVKAHRKQYVFRVRMGVSCFAHSHRLEVLATGSLDHAVRLWTPFSPQRPVACLSSHTSGVVGVAIAEQPHLLFSLSQDLSLCVWDIKEHHLLQTISIKFPFTQRLPDFGPSPLTLLLRPSPSLAVSCNEYMARFTLNAGPPLEGVRLDVSHSHPVCSVVYCPSLDQLVSGCEGGEVKVWEVTSGRCVMKMEGCHGDQELTALAVDSEGSRILTGAHDGAIKVWETLTGQLLQSLTTTGSSEVACILHIPERQRFLATGWSRAISVFEDKVLRLSPEPAWNEGTPHCDDIIAMDYCPPCYLVTGSFDGLIVVWNTDTRRILSEFHSMAKMRCLVLRPTTRPHPHSPLSTPSRPASRRLSSYHLKSASSSHLLHVPVDQLLFLTVRVRSKVTGQLVSSEGGHAHFWDMFSSGPPLGNFALTPHQGEVVLALAADQPCQRLLAGDTAGHLTIFNIEHFCTAPQAKQAIPTSVCSWQAHSSEILSVVWVGPCFVVSASADQSVRMWTTEGHSIGYFGQPQCWNSADPTTFCHQPPHSPPSGQVEGLEGGLERGKTGGGKERGNGGKTRGGGEMELKESQVETPTEELTSLNDKSLGVAYQTGVERRMAGRLQRRTQFAEVDTSVISRFPALFSPFQALHIPDVPDVEI